MATCRCSCPSQTTKLPTVRSYTRRGTESLQEDKNIWMQDLVSKVQMVMVVPIVHRVIVRPLSGLRKLVRNLLVHPLDAAAGV